MPKLSVKKLRQDSWKPQFSWQTDINVIADMINLPHEDYPARVDRTKTMLNLFDNADILDEDIILGIHAYIMHDLEPENRGKYRNCQVYIGRHVPPAPSEVPKYMEQILSVGLFANEKAAKDWYIDFETIHPFIDGNGRVGGIVLAILSRRWNHKLQCLEYLTPDSFLDKVVEFSKYMHI
jgi:fido (protein-threonine AMPylation protein)